MSEDRYADYDSAWQRDNDDLAAEHELKEEEMPAKSRQQQKWAYAVKGPEWAKKHHFDKMKPSPKSRAPKKKKP